MAGRHVGIAMDFSAASKNALDWALRNFVHDRDHVILLVVHRKTESNAHFAQLWEDQGTPLIPLVEFKEDQLLQKYGIKKDIEVLDMLETINRQKELVIVTKLYWGDAREKLHQAVGQLKLDCLFMGSRGLGTIKGALMGSVSSYIVTYAECPVTVVKLPPTK